MADYDELAAALLSEKPKADHPAFVALNIQWRCDCQAIANLLARKSDGFDRVAFFRLCGDTESAEAWANG